MNLYLRISEQHDIESLKLTATEVNIMNYIYHHIEHIDSITVNVIADKCHCSTAAIHRFVKKFNCDGFKEFKTELISGKKITKFSNSKFQINMNELVSYIQELDLEQFKTELMKLQTKRVYVYGVGGSYVSAQYLVRQLNRFDIDAVAYQPSDRSGLKDLADAAILISHSGETSELVAKAKTLQLEAIKSFAITKQESTLAKLVNYALVHNDSFSVDNFNERESQLATILLIEKLFYELS